MELVQRQTQQLTQQTLQSLALLQMSTVELEAYVQELAQENPIIDLEPPRSEQEAPRDQELFRRVKWLEDSDRQNRYYQRLDAEELDPLAQVGTDGGLEESLSNFLFRQIQQLDILRLSALGNSSRALRYVQNEIIRHENNHLLLGRQTTRTFSASGVRESFGSILFSSCLILAPSLCSSPFQKRQYHRRSVIALSVPSVGWSGHSNARHI